MQETPTPKNKDVTFVSEFLEKLFSLIGLKCEIKVTLDEENQAVRVEIASGEETGLLIGKKGGNIFALQNVIAMALRNKTGEWKRVVVDVGQWREKQEEYLQKLAFETAQRVKESGKPEVLYNLNPAQRRIVHLALKGSEDVVTASEGEGRERFLVVKPL